MQTIEIRKQLCNRITQIRKEYDSGNPKKGMSQTTLAKRLGVPQPSIAYIEKGEHSPYLDKLLQLLQQLNYTVIVAPDFSATATSDSSAGASHANGDYVADLSHIGFKAQRRHICRRIAQLRKEKGMQQMELERIAGVTRGYLSEIEAGRYSPKLDILIALLQPLGYTIDFVPIVSAKPTNQN